MDGHKRRRRQGRQDSLGLEPLEARQLLSVDLSGTIAPVTGPAYNGSRAALQLAITNNGDTKNSKAFSIAVYAVAEGVAFSPETAVLLTTVKRTGAIKAGATVALTVSPQVGANLPAGDYRFYAVLDSTNKVAETDETNNVVQSNTVAVRPRRVDLTAGITLEPNPTMAGDSLTAAVADVTITNTASSADAVAAGKSVKVTVVARLVGATSTARDIGLNYMPVSVNVGGLAPGAKVTKAVQLKFPPTMPAGTYNIIVKVDTGNSVTETDETNNFGMLATTLVVVPRVVTPPPAGTTGPGSVLPTPMAMTLGGGRTMIKLTSPPATVPVPVPTGSGSSVPLPEGGGMPVL